LSACTKSLLAGLWCREICVAAPGGTDLGAVVCCRCCCVVLLLLLCFALPQGSLLVSDSLNHTSLVNGSRASGATIRVFKHDGAWPLACMEKLAGCWFKCVDG
jgi:hypothetical protein